MAVSGSLRAGRRHCLEAGPSDDDRRHAGGIRWRAAVEAASGFLGAVGRDWRWARDEWGVFCSDDGVVWPYGVAKFIVN